MKKQSSKKFKQNLPTKKVVFKKPRKQKEADKQKSPRNYRFIPELSVTSVKTIFLSKYFLVSFISTFISVGIVMQGIDLTKHVRELQRIQSERHQVAEEIVYWEEIIAEHKDYRDAYFKLALLEYRLGNTKRASYYVEKTLSLDPNYQPARDFAKRLDE